MCLKWTADSTFWKMDLEVMLLLKRYNSDNFWNLGLLHCQDCGLPLWRTAKIKDRDERNKNTVRARQKVNSQHAPDGIPHRQMSCWACEFKVEGAQAQVLVKRSAGDRLNLVSIGTRLSSRTDLGWNLMKLMSGPGAHMWSSEWKTWLKLMNFS